MHTPVPDSKIASTTQRLTDVASRYMHFSELLTIAQNDENPDIDDPRVRQLTSLVLHFRDEPEVQRAVDPYRQRIEATPSLPFGQQIGRIRYKVLAKQELVPFVDAMSGALEVYNTQAQASPADVSKVVDGVSAHEIIYKCNLAFAMHYAKQFKPFVPYLETNDLFSASARGIERAVKSYYPALGAFTTHSRYFAYRNISRLITAEQRQRSRQQALEDYTAQSNGAPLNDVIPGTTHLAGYTEETITLMDALERSSLTQRQKDVCARLTMGLSILEISQEIGVHRTVIEKNIRSMRPLIRDVLATN